jgi:uncharacterized membrane protein
MFDVILRFHIACGALGLILGPVSMWAKKKKGLHTQIGKVYYALIFGVCISAIALSILHWEKSAYFFPIALFSFGLGFKGYTASRRRQKDWILSHISGMVGSYIALVTAFLVANLGRVAETSTLATVLAWSIPTLVGAPLIWRIEKQYASR